MVLSIAALTLAAISLGWQVYDRLYTRRTRLCVEAERVPNPSPDPAHHYLRVRITNRSEHRVKVAEVLPMQGDRSWTDLFLLSDRLQPVELPLGIESRASADVAVVIGDLTDLQFGEPSTVRVATALNETFESKPVVLIPRMPTPPLRPRH